MKEYLVGEITKRWSKSRDHNNTAIGRLFTALINGNVSAGWTLESWQLSRVAVGGGVSETIVAIFSRPKKGEH
jgi:hypothetical protein